jgi:hypothetical protein
MPMGVIFRSAFTGLPFDGSKISPWSLDGAPRRSEIRNSGRKAVQT